MSKSSILCIFRLERHKQGVHEKVKAFPCTMCNMSFFDKSHLKNHIACRHIDCETFRLKDETGWIRNKALTKKRKNNKVIKKRTVKYEEKIKDIELKNKLSEEANKSLEIDPLKIETIEVKEDIPLKKRKVKKRKISTNNALDFKE